MQTLANAFACLFFLLITISCFFGARELHEIYDQLSQIKPIVIFYSIVLLIAGIVSAILTVVFLIDTIADDNIKY